MCLAIPMRVLSMEGTTALCEGRNGVARLDTLLTGPLEPGQWVLNFLGMAKEVVSEEEAQQIDSALNGLEAILAGDVHSVDQHFADLVNREPQLPEHLRHLLPQEGK